MVSLAARRGASSALTSYNSLRSGRTRLARRVLGLGLRTGLAQPLLRDKIDIGVMRAQHRPSWPTNCSATTCSSSSAVGRLSWRFGGGSGPYRKPVLQVFAARRGAARVHQGGLERLDPRGGQP